MRKVPMRYTRGAAFYHYGVIHIWNGSRDIHMENTGIGRLNNELTIPAFVVAVFPLIPLSNGVNALPFFQGSGDHYVA